MSRSSLLVVCTSTASVVRPSSSVKVTMFTGSSSGASGGAPGIS